MKILEFIIPVFVVETEEEKKRRLQRETYETNLNQYREIIAKLQQEFPHCLDDMPGFNAAEIAERERSIVEDMPKLNYSKRYDDSKHEYRYSCESERKPDTILIRFRHVILPKGIAKWLPNRLMSEAEWRSLGVIQSPGWVHYMIHDPEPHVLLFKRPLPPKDDSAKKWNFFRKTAFSAKIKIF